MHLRWPSRQGLPGFCTCFPGVSAGARLDAGGVTLASHCNLLKANRLVELWASIGPHSRHGLVLLLFLHIKKIRIQGAVNVHPAAAEGGGRQGSRVLVLMYRESRHELSSIRFQTVITLLPILLNPRPLLRIGSDAVCAGARCASAAADDPLSRQNACIVHA